MHRFKSAFYLIIAASLLCTGCAGNVAGPAEEAEKTDGADKEFVSDVKLEQGGSVAAGTAFAKAAAR